MQEIDKLTIKPDVTIRQAMKIIDEGACKIALVIDDENRLIGTLTDGDIRRGLLNGQSLDDSILGFINRNPFIGNIKDSRETLTKKILGKKLYQIPIVDDNGILVGMENLDDLVSVKQRPNKIVLMAGGLGTRLGELTKNIPKPMLKVGDKPILETIIENFLKYGFSNIIISVNYLSHVIEDYFGDGGKMGANITYIRENTRLGTAGSLDLMRESLTEPFFVMNGDILTNIKFDHLYDYHMAKEAAATMCVREYDFQVPYGTVNIDDGKIISIDEKPIHKFFVSTGINMLSPEALEYVPHGEYFDMPSLFERLIAENKKAVSFPMREYWVDIGQIKDYERANVEYSEVFRV